MAGEDSIRMTLQDRVRLKVIHEVLSGHITQRKAASLLGRSERQVRRMVQSVRERGDIGILHRGRGRPSNQKLGEAIKVRVIQLWRKRYEGFGPTLAAEKLLEHEGITVSRETVRQWLLEAGLWTTRRKSRQHRQWRVRKECRGEMVQMDGSHHAWLEDRGPALVLMGYIDDATGEVYGQFHDYEGTEPAMESFKGYVRKNGLPVSVYFDRHTTYRSTRRLTAEEEVAGIVQPLSEFERALTELGVRVIHAYSPQAKGRIERLFGTLQDRLVKEMRLRGISTKAEANAFLREYLPAYNRRFAVVPANPTDVHRRPGTGFNLDRYLCLKADRTVRNDNTVSYKGRLYQLQEKALSRKVTVEERLNGSLFIRCGEMLLRYREITDRPRKVVAVAEPRQRKKPSLPGKNHPWKNGRLKAYIRKQVYAETAK
jgi:transposase